MTQPKTASKFTPGPVIGLYVKERYDEQTHIAGPFYLEDEEGTVRAEGITSMDLARKFAQAPEMYELLEMIGIYYTRVVKNPSSLPSLKIALDEFPSASDIYREARRIKAAIDEEG